MTLQEIQALVAAGYTKTDIQALKAAPVQPATPVQPEAASPAIVQPATPVQPETQQIDFIAGLQALGALINQQGQQPTPTNVQLPASLQPATQPQIEQAAPAATPSNAGLTPEDATKLFQAWSMGQATQNIELPPTADEILEARFKSLYGVDVTKK